MWTPPQISHEDPSLPQGFTSHLLLSDPALPPTVLCYLIPLFSPLLPGKHSL